MTGVDVEAWTCPLPLRDYPRVVLGHGGGGALSEELVRHLFVPAFGNPALDALGDASLVDVPADREDILRHRDVGRKRCRDQWRRMIT